MKNTKIHLLLLLIITLITKNHVHAMNEQKTYSHQEQFICLPCNRTFNHKANYAWHIKSQLHATTIALGQEKLLVCPECKTTFSQLPTFKRHMIRIHPQKPHKCEMCTKAFAEKTALVQHMRTHTNIKSYTCTICNTHYAQQIRYEQHVAYHTQQLSRQSPYACSSCKYHFAKKTHADRHLQTTHHLATLSTYSTNITNVSSNSNLNQIYIQNNNDLHSPEDSLFEKLFDETNIIYNINTDNDFNQLFLQ
jgi:uncharacterized Zn-finger protein